MQPIQLLESKKKELEIEAQIIYNKIEKTPNEFGIKESLNLWLMIYK